jgi:steroid 5-alpha reductase family enzyme
MVVAWALRLGTYLVIRITRDGADKYVPRFSMISCEKRGV